MTPVQFVFLLLAGLTLIAALRVVSAPNLVHAALWLILVLAGVAALFVLLELGFLAVVQVVVYIGAISILIIFGVMLTRRVLGDAGPQVNRSWWAAALAAALLFAGLAQLLLTLPGAAALPQALADPEALLPALGLALVDLDGYVVPFEVASVLLLAAMIGAIAIARPPAPGDAEGGQA